MSEMSNNFKIPTHDLFHAFREQTGQDLQVYADKHADAELDKSIKEHFSVKSTREELGQFDRFSKKWGIPITHVISALSAFPGVSAFFALVFSFFPFLGFELYKSDSLTITAAVLVGFLASAAALYGIEAGFDFFLYRLAPKLLNKALRQQYGKSLTFLWIGTISMALLSFCTSFFGATEAPKVVIETPKTEIAKLEDVTAPTNKAMDLISEQAKSYDSQIASEQATIQKYQSHKKGDWSSALKLQAAKKAKDRLQQEKAASVGNLTGLGVTTINGISSRNAAADSTVQRSNRQKIQDYEKRVLIGSWVNGGISIFAQVMNALLVIFVCWFEFTVAKEQTAIAKHTNQQNVPAIQNTPSKQPAQTYKTDPKEVVAVFGTNESEIDANRKPSVKEVAANIIKPVAYNGREYSIEDVQNILKKIKKYHERSLEKPSGTGANYDKSVKSKANLKAEVQEFVGVLSVLGIECVFNGKECKINYPKN